MFLWAGLLRMPASGGYSFATRPKGLVRRIDFLWVLGATSLFAVSLATGWWLRPIQDNATRVPGLIVDNRDVDVGLLATQESKTADFKLSNHGSESLHILEVIPDCGCVVVKPERKVIASGTSLVIPATIDANRVTRTYGTKPTPFVKRVAVQFKGKTPGAYDQVVLTLTGAVEPYSGLSAVPSSINFGRVVAGQRMEQKVQFQGPEQIVNEIPSQVVISSVAPTTINIRRSNNSAAKISTKTVTFTMTVPTTEASELELSVLLNVGNPASNRLLLPVRGEVVPDVVIAPRRLLLTQSPDGGSKEVYLRVSSPLVDKPLIAGVHSDLPVDCKVVDTDKGDELLLQVALKTDHKPVHVKTGDLRIELTSPRTEVRVPVVIVLREPAA